MTTEQNEVILNEVIGVMKGLANLRDTHKDMKLEAFFYVMFYWIANGFFRDKNELERNREILHRLLEKAFVDTQTDRKEEGEDE